MSYQGRILFQNLWKYIGETDDDDNDEEDYDDNHYIGDLIGDTQCKELNNQEIQRYCFYGIVYQQLQCTQV